MATDNRFIKVGGSFARPDVMAGQNALSSLIMPRTLDLSTLNSQSPATALAAPQSGPPTTGRSIPMIPPAGTPPVGSPPGIPSPYVDQSAPTDGSQPDASSTQDGSNPVDNFNLLLTGLLKTAQGVSTADLLKKKRLIERAVLGQTSEITPEDMRTLSPEQQNAIRSGKTSALQPEIDNNAYQLEKAQQSIDNFFKVFDEAQKISQDFADKMVAPDSVIQNARMVIESNPGAMSTVLAGFNDKSKQKIIEGLDYSKLGSGTKRDTSIQTIDGEQFVIDNQTGEKISQLGSKTGGDASALKDNAKSSAQALMDKFDKGQGTSAVGKSGAFNSFGYGLLPGTERANFIVQFNNLKSLLSLDNVKYLKGQGQVSDAERRLLEQASAKLDLAQSEPEFRAALQDVINALSGPEDTSNAGGGGIVQTTAGAIDTNW